MENVIISSDTYFMPATLRLTGTGVNTVGGGNNLSNEISRFLTQNSAEKGEDEIAGFQKRKKAHVLW